MQSLQTLFRKEQLSSDLAESVMNDIVSAKTKPEQVGAFLASLHFQPPTGKAIAGFVKAIRKHSILVPATEQEFPHLVDVCGTGGDATNTFNISTCVAFVAAAAGLSIAKHGNRAVSSKSGSFDVLDSLGIAFSKTPTEAISALRQAQITFMYAPDFHPSFRALAEIRRSLGVRTILNVLGPLLNPANVRRQLIGVYSQQLLIPVAEAMLELGAREALIVAAEDGTDEISICAPTNCAHVKNGNISFFKFTPEDFGFQRAKIEMLRAGDAQQSAEILVRILEGESGPRREVVLLNAAAALHIGGIANDMMDGISLAAESIDSGRAMALVKKLQLPVKEGKRL